MFSTTALTLLKTERRIFRSTINFDVKNEIFQNSQFRFRGSSDWHLRLEKPSLRIKLRNYETYKMMRHLNFTFPEGRGIIENYYADLISKNYSNNTSLVSLIIELNF